VVYYLHLVTNDMYDTGVVLKASLVASDASFVGAYEYATATCGRPRVWRNWMPCLESSSFGAVQCQSYPGLM